MFSRIKESFKASNESIKLMAIEETFDIYFSRFFGHYFALWAKNLMMTPNAVSVASLIVGLIAGVFFFFQDNALLISLGCVLITISGVLDSADGQLARMTKQVSDLGRKIDAIIDTFVFVACYTGGSFYFLIHGYGFWILPLALIAGYFHSVKSGVYEFYKTEFLYYTFKSDHFRIPFTDELEKPAESESIWARALYLLEIDYIRKQAIYHGRSKEKRQRFERLAFDEITEFAKKYAQTNTKIMTWWAIVCGTNTHRTAIMIFSLFGRLDLYFYFSIITFFPMLLIVKKQKKLDNNLLQDYSKK